MLDDLPISDVERLMVELAHGGYAEKTGEIVEEHLATGGKRLRARLALAATRCLGTSPEASVPWAAACELLHNATLIHDDLQDGDRVRRGAPTTWVRHGMPSAVNSGDLLLMLPTLAIARLERPADVCWPLSKALAESATQVIRGQVAEFEMMRLSAISVASYDHAIAGKTAPLFELPVLGAALISGCSSSDAKAIAHPFRTLGLLFQIQDDILDLYGEKGRESPGADINEGKISVFVVKHLEAFPDERDSILRLLRLPRHETPPDEVVALISRFRTAGTLRRVLEKLNCEASSARAEIAALGRSELSELLDAIEALVLDPITHLL